MNNNSILIGTIYILLNDKTLKFFRIFDITISTIDKFVSIYTLN